MGYVIITTQIVVQNGLFAHENGGFGVEVVDLPHENALESGNLQKGGDGMQMKYGVGSENRHNLDSRKRVFIPSRIRELLGRDLVISRDIMHDRPCLCIYSSEGWDARIERILADCESEEERQDMLDVLCYCMIPAELDDQGRVTLTKQLIDHAELVKEVVITGAGDHACIWSAGIYDDMRSAGNDLASLKAILGRKHKA